MSDDSRPKDSEKLSLDAWLKLSEQEQLEREPLVSTELFATPSVSSEFVTSVMSAVAKEEVRELPGEESWRKEFLFQALPLQVFGALASLFLFFQAETSGVVEEGSIPIGSVEFSVFDTTELGSDELTEILFGDSSLDKFLPEFLEEENHA